MSKYIVIPNIRVSNANAQPVWWIVSASPITAYAGFAHALALHLQAMKHEGIAIVHHDIQFLGETLENQYKKTTFYPHQLRAASFINSDDHVHKVEKRYSSLVAKSTARCHLNVSLVIAIPEETQLSTTRIARFLRGARIAGGSVIQYDKISIENTRDDALKAIRKNGFSLIERQDLMQVEEEKGDRDIIDTLLRHTRRYMEQQEKVDAWVVPTCLGYAGISSIKKRNKIRNELPHLYVEPLVGLIQYRSTRHVGLHFWRYAQLQPDVFILSTK